MRVLLERSGRLVDQASELRQKGCRAGVVGELGEGAQYILLADGESGADGVRVDAHPFELPKQVSEAFRL